MNGKKFFYHMFLIIILIFVNNIRGQLPESMKKSRGDLPVFFHEIFIKAAQNPDTSRMIFFMKIPYDELQFILKDNIYQAGYELSLTVLDSDDNVIDNKIERESVVVSEYDLTNSRKEFSSSTFYFNLLPDEYKLVIEVMDIDSKMISIIREKVTVIDYSKSNFGMSDILFYDRMEDKVNNKIIYDVNILRNFGKEQKEVFLGFELYNNVNFDSIRMRLNIYTLNNKLLKQYNYYKVLKGFRTSVMLKIPRESMGRGYYKLSIEVGEDENVIKKGKIFSVDWMNMPAGVNNIDEAIKQLKYIATSGEIKKLTNAAEEEKKDKFEKFWKSKDPTPDTEVNELKKEYYRRVGFANRNFGKYLPGWMTDRGMVYIVLGPPDHIDRYPYEINTKPYQVWKYYRLGKQLIFLDYSGFGEYRLIPDSRHEFNLVR